MSIENIPPTQDALFQHMLRAWYEACHVWYEAIMRFRHLPSPANLGYIHCTMEDQMDKSPGEACRVVMQCVDATRDSRNSVNAENRDCHAHQIASVVDVNDST